MLKFSKKQSLFLIFFILFSFFWGFLLWSNNKINLLLESISLKRNNTTIENIGYLLNNSNKNIDLKLFNEAYRIIQDNYYSFQNISQEDIISWMIKWIVWSLNDKHSEYFNIEETKQFNETLNWDFEGIWAVIQKNDFWVYIDRLIVWSPAKEAGLLSWDIIIKANWIDLKNLSLIDSVNKIKWPAWTKVSLEIIRPWEKEIIKKDVIRKKINIPSVDSKIIDGNWYIMLSIFWEKTGNEFKKALDDLNSKNIKWLIVDLRDNGWWYLETAVSIISNFVDKDKILVTTKEKNPLNNKSYFSYWNDSKKIPIVVLINWNSASASEITAWAFKDYNIAIIVWEKSYGKWSVQEPFILSDWSELKVTVAKWFTPLDHWIDWIWINPDIEVNFTKEDYTNGFDRQLDEAKKILNKFIEFKDNKKTIEYYLNLKKEEEKRKLSDITNSWTTLTWSIK